MYVRIHKQIFYDAPTNMVKVVVFCVRSKKQEVLRCHQAKVNSKKKPITLTVPITNCWHYTV